LQFTFWVPPRQVAAVNGGKAGQRSISAELSNKVGRPRVPRRGSSTGRVSR
jgi:hypothetical protein